MSTPVRHDRSPAAFTLIELMVAMAVMVLLMSLVIQLVNNATSATNGGNKHMDADTQARFVLDRMGIDIARIVQRSDVDYYFQKQAGNDQMAFYSESTGYFPTSISGSVPKSNVSLVGYRVNGNHQLERLGKALVWNGVTSATAGASGLTASDLPMVYLPRTLTGAWPQIAGANADPDYQVIGDLVYRLEISFLLKAYTDAAGTFHPAVLSDTPWDAGRGHSEIKAFRDVSAIVVAIGLLDNRTRAQTDATALDTAIGKLPDSGSASAPVKLWQAKIQARDVGLPEAASSQVRVYQRYFYLNPVQ